MVPRRHHETRASTVAGNELALDVREGDLAAGDVVQEGNLVRVLRQRVGALVHGAGAERPCPRFGQ